MFGFWLRRSGGKERFGWAEPWAFRRLKLCAELRDWRRGPLLWLVLLFPGLVLLNLWIRAVREGHAVHGKSAAAIAVAAWGAVVGAMALLVRLPVRVSIREEFVSWANGRAYRRWGDLTGFALIRHPDFLVLALHPKRGQPLYLGVAPEVPPAALEAYLRSRGLERRVDDAGFTAQFPAATK